MHKYTCQVCGYPELEEAPWGEDGKTASFNICPCCGVEFGYEDITEEGMSNFRNKWIGSGGKWFNEKMRPENWDMKEQLKNIGVSI
jgi:hypothetical protein